MIQSMAEINCVDQLKVLADETRLQVLRLLLTEPRTVGALNEVLQIDQTLLSHHLRTLRKSGLVVGTRQGKHVRYELATGVRPADGTDGIDLGCCTLSFATLPPLETP